MKRDVSALHSMQFDVVVVGAGIHGACIARDAALRGLRVALVDKGDLGGATSHNSLKTIHGGVRYLQHLNIKRTLEHIREQLCIKSTLESHVKPVAFLMPTYGYGMRGPFAMWVGLQLYNVLVVFMALRSGQKRLSERARVISAKRTRSSLSPDQAQGVTGGALWYELQVEQADRALLDIVADAAAHHCCVASYVKIDGLSEGPSAGLSEKRSDGLAEGNNQLSGVTASDVLTGEQFKIQARVVVNATGPWVGSGFGNSGSPQHDLPMQVPVSKSMNIVINRHAEELAVGLQSRYQSDSVVGQTKRLYFTVPWKGLLMVGTTHSDKTISPNALHYDETDIVEFLNDTNAIFPHLQLKMQDVLYCYQGLTPLAESTDTEAAVLHHSLVIDHAMSGGPENLLSVVGVKWTTARSVAQDAVNLVAIKLGMSTESETLTRPVPVNPDLPLTVSSFNDADLAAFCKTHMQKTMTLMLSDMLLRRTDDFVLNKLSLQQFSLIASTMAAELGWDEQTCIAQHQRVLDSALPEWRRQTLAALQWWD